jgi:HK97 family phage prohead protease
MKTYFEVKNVIDSVKDVDTTSRRVKVVISRMVNKDLDGDVIELGAFDKTIRERGPSGANLIWHLTDHYPSLKNAVGKFSELYANGNDLVGVTDIPKTTWGNDVLEFYSSGHINQHSIGFRTIKKEPVNAGTPDEYTSLKEILLYEGSSVLWGANPMTPTVSVGKSEIKTELDKLSDEWGALMKSLRSGHFTDDTFELIELRINQNQERQKQLFEMLTTQPAEKAVEPVSKASVLDDLLLLTIKHF